MLSSQIVHVLPYLPLSLIPVILLLPQWKLKSNPFLDPNCRELPVISSLDFKIVSGIGYRSQ